MGNNMVRMTHISDPTSSYTTVPERSFREYWAAKGWFTDVDLPEEVQEPEVSSENNNTTTEEQT